MFFVILKCRTFAETLPWLSFEAVGEVRCPRDKYEMTFWDKHELALQIACSHLPFVHRQSNTNFSMKCENTSKTWKLFLKDWAKLYAWPILRFVEQTFKETFRNKTTLQRHPFAISLSSQPSSSITPLLYFCQNFLSFLVEVLNGLSLDQHEINFTYFWLLQSSVDVLVFLVF